MKYNQVISAKFIKRPNRFIAHVLIDGKEVAVHVRNTGRCKELLVPGCRVYLEKSSNANRKTPYTLIGVEKQLPNGQFKTVNMDSSAPNDLIEQWFYDGNLFGADAIIKREIVYGNSRFDFYVEYKERRAFIEVKGVTLENNRVAMFPDAPTERGLKHLNELCKCKKEGYEAYVIFVVKMEGVEYFTPNSHTHPKFAEGLKNAISSGVKAIALECSVTPSTLDVKKEIEIRI